MIDVEQKYLKGGYMSSLDLDFYYQEKFNFINYEADYNTNSNMKGMGKLLEETQVNSNAIFSAIRNNNLKFTNGKLVPKFSLSNQLNQFSVDLEKIYLKAIKVINARSDFEPFIFFSGEKKIVYDFPAMVQNILTLSESAGAYAYAYAENSNENLFFLAYKFDREFAGRGLPKEISEIIFRISYQINRESNLKLSLESILAKESFLLMLSQYTT